MLFVPVAFLDLLRSAFLGFCFQLLRGLAFAVTHFHSLLFSLFFFRFILTRIPPRQGSGCSRSLGPVVLSVRTLIEAQELIERLFPLLERDRPPVKDFLSLRCDPVNPLRRTGSSCIPLRRHQAFALHASELTINRSHVRWTGMETKAVDPLDEFVSIGFFSLQGHQDERLQQSRNPSFLTRTNILMMSCFVAAFTTWLAHIYV
jgi:hypothetical protein